MQDQHTIYFKGNQITTSHGIAAWVFMIMPLVFCYIYGFSLIMLVAFLFCLGFFLLGSLALNYFSLSTYYIEVRNHNILWKSRKYYFEDIQEVVLDDPRGDICMTIVLKTTKKKTHQASSLSYEKGLLLKYALQEKGIPVRDEIGLEEKVKPRAKKINRAVNIAVGIFFLMLGVLTYFLARHNVSKRKTTLIFLILFLLFMIGLFLFYLRWADKWFPEDDKEKSGQ